MRRKKRAARLSFLHRGQPPHRIVLPFLLIASIDSSPARRRSASSMVFSGVFPTLFPIFRYHRLTRVNTPDSVSFRRFLPFSPWLAPASLRLKNQKSLENTSLAGVKQFCRRQKCVQTRKGPQRILAVLSRDLTRYGRISERQNRVFPCQSMVKIIQKIIDGNG